MPNLIKLFASALSLTLVFLAAPHVSAQEASAPNPAIWKITDHDSEIWLFGTIHILNPSLNWRSEKVNQAFAVADTVYFEAPADQQGMQPLIMQHGLNPQGTTLSMLMSDKGKTDLRNALQSLGLPLGMIQQLEPLRPWLAGLTLAAFQIQAQGGDPNAGVERILQADARASGKSIQYLETDAEQVGFLSGMSQKAQIFFLEDGLRAMIEEPDILQRLIGGWVKGDVELVDATMIHAMQGQQELYATLLVNRNKRWAAQIRDMLAGSGRTFIAVGAAHLAGGNSVQYYLGDYGIVPVRQ